MGGWVGGGSVWGEVVDYIVSHAPHQGSHSSTLGVGIQTCHVQNSGPCDSVDEPG